MPKSAASLLLNLAAKLSTTRWQQKIRAELAVGGYQESAVRRLIATSWIRTALFLVQAVLAVVVTLQKLAKSPALPLIGTFRLSQRTSLPGRTWLP